MCHTGGEAFKRRLTHGVVLIIMELCTAVKQLIAKVLKCKASYKTQFKYVCVTMYSLVMSLFSHDYIKTEID